MLKKIKKLETERLNLKKSLENSYLSDRDIPVRERFETWLKMPSYLKNHNEFLHRGFDRAYAKYRGYVPGAVSWYDEMYADRYATMDIAGILNYCVEGMEDLEAYEPGDEFEDPKFVELIEFVLSENLGSFCYDW